MMFESHPAAFLARPQYVQLFSALGQSGLIAVTLLLQGLKIRLQLCVLPGNQDNTMLNYVLW